MNPLRRIVISVVALSQQLHKNKGFKNCRDIFLLRFGSMGEIFSESIPVPTFDLLTLQYSNKVRRVLCHMIMQKR